MLGMKITVNFDISILTPVAVVTKEPKRQCTALIPCGQIPDWIAEKVMIPHLLDLLDSKEIGSQLIETSPNKTVVKVNKYFH